VPLVQQVRAQQQAQLKPQPVQKPEEQQPVRLEPQLQQQEWQL
jgi:hypothetical protein